MDVRQVYINELFYRLCLALFVTKDSHSSTFIKMLCYTIKKLVVFISTNLKLLYHDTHLNYIITAYFPFTTSRIAIGELQLTVLDHYYSICLLVTIKCLF